VPQIDRFEDNGYTREEMKVVWESRKILGLPELPVTRDGGARAGARRPRAAVNVDVRARGIPR
jgi:aspartate-semialdehyde dehydrogenase